MGEETKQMVVCIQETYLTKKKIIDLKPQRMESNIP